MQFYLLFPKSGLEKVPPHLSSFGYYGTASVAAIFLSNTGFIWIMGVLSNYAKYQVK